MATFSQLMSAHRRSGKSYASSASTATIQKTLSAIDPRQVFDRNGVITALLPFLKSYEPRVARRGGSEGSMAVRNAMNGVREELRNLNKELKNVTGELKNVSKISSMTATNTKIVAKNTIGIPLMARDINIMRQNIQKLVRINSETPATKADKDWLRASERETAYEVQFGNSGQSQTSPTQQSLSGAGEDSGSKGGFFESLLSLIGGKLLLTGIITAITAYFASPEFKKSVDDMINKFGEFMFGVEGWNNLKESLKTSIMSLMEDVKKIMIDLAVENWKIIAAGLALYFGPSLLNLAASLTNLAAIFSGGKGVIGGGLIKIFKSLGGVLFGPVGAIAGLAALAKIAFDAQDELYKNFDESKVPPPKKPEEILGKIKSGKDIIDLSKPEFEIEVEKRAQKKAGILARSGMKVKDSEGNYTREYLKTLDFYRKEARKELEAEISLENKKKLDKKLKNSKLGNSVPGKSTISNSDKIGPAFESSPSIENRQTKTISPEKLSASVQDEIPQTKTEPVSATNSIEMAKGLAEKYLGRAISIVEWENLVRATYAESSNNSSEYANVMAVILNRARESGKSIIDVLNEKNQFQAVTGTKNSPGPSQNFISGPTDSALSNIIKGAESLENISKNLDAFSAASTSAYKEGTNIGWRDKLLSSGGNIVGKSVFAENLYTPSGQVTNITDNSQTVNNFNDSKQQSPISQAVSSIVDFDLMKELMGYSIEK